MARLLVFFIIKFMFLSVCLYVCLPLDNLGTTTLILFLFRTVVEVLPGQTHIHYEQNPTKLDALFVSPLILVVSVLVN